MTRLLSALLCALLFVSPVYAGTGTITTKDAAGATKTFDVITDGSGNFGTMSGVCDGAALAQCQAVKAASTAPVATDPAAVVTLSQNAGLGSAATPLQVSLANTAANGTPVAVSLTSTTITGSVAVTNAGTFATQLTGATNNINNIAGTISLPTGAATSANQTSQITQETATAAALGTTGDAAGCGTNTVVSCLKQIDADVKSGVGATGSAVPAAAIYPGYNVAGNLVGAIGDPCQTVAATYTPISITTATTTRIIAPTASKKTYVCGMVLFANGADNVGIVEGTGGTCGTGTAGVLGGTTAANGLNLLANEGTNMGNGASAVLGTAGTNVDFCLITSAAVSLAGHVKWVAQ